MPTKDTVLNIDKIEKAKEKSRQKYQRMKEIHANDPEFWERRKLRHKEWCKKRRAINDPERRKRTSRYKREWYAKDPERRERWNAYMRKWRDSPEYRKRQAEYARKQRVINREKITKRDRDRYAADAEYRQRKIDRAIRQYAKPEYHKIALERAKARYEPSYGNDEEGIRLRHEQFVRSGKKVGKARHEAMEQRKSEFLKALDENIGIVTTACMKQGITRDAYYGWLRHDPEFVEKVREIKDRGVDFAEDMLMSRIVAGDLQAVTFFLRSQGKHRGWNDKIDVNVSSNTNASITDKIMDNLDEETRSKLVSAYKQVRNESSSLPATSDVIDVQAEKTKLRIGSNAK
jgi:hypothetical protein